ncbi:MAG: phosphoenolpyruvate--protein phosphotransferase [Chloroherpetonaceae bacterium]|nr:phosphoenolpyruvate--protein phosphotransferase [Chloroherpetonaceae bacterium]
MPDSPEKKGFDLSEEITLVGISASKGIGIGPLYIYNRDKFQAIDVVIESNECDSELERFDLAISRSAGELQKIAGITEQKIGTLHAEIFTSQIQMLHDPEFHKYVHSKVKREKRSVEGVVSEFISDIQNKLLQSDELLFRERVDDFQDLKDRILRNLSEGQLISRIPENVVVFSHSLTPADLILFSRQNFIGCAVDTGGQTSHAALICQSLALPMVAGLVNVAEKLRENEKNLTAIIDGNSGKFIINPNSETLALYLRKQKRLAASALSLVELTEQEARTKCGKRIQVLSNIDFKEELQHIERYGADGVGLYRSESMFIAKGKPPAEEEQFEYYSELADVLNPKLLTLRLFDVGGDKLIYSSYREENPNLGWRGVRVLLDVPEILEQQLRALLRANKHGNIQILVPMVSSLDEIRNVKKILSKIKGELRKLKQLHVEEVKIGVMIEIPAAVEIIEEIVKEVDFISIGTNDLIQYTLAVDRGNEIVHNLYNKFHPALIRKLSRIIRAAYKHKCRVSLCGEMASDSYATPLLLGLGLRDFSVVNSAIPDLKKTISQVRLSQAKELAKKCLTLGTVYEIEHLIKHFKPLHVGA